MEVPEDGDIVKAPVLVLGTFPNPREFFAGPGKTPSCPQYLTLRQFQTGPKTSAGGG